MSSVDSLLNIWRSHLKLFIGIELAFGLASGCSVVLSIPLSVHAQPVADRSLGTRIVREDAQTDVIEGGLRSSNGSSLFHSFRTFDIPENHRVYFQNPAGVETIFSRVTGGDRSEIQGTLGVRGNADLFLLNPNGIVFGPNAQLDLNGSFLATSANSIVFSDSAEFSATSPNAAPLLTVNVPIGLQFGRSPGEIVNRSRQNLTIERGIPVAGGLQVATGETIGLVGSHIRLLGGVLSAPSGRVELGSVAADSEVGLALLDQGFQLDYGSVEQFRNIHLSQGAVATAGTLGTARGGDVQAFARHLQLTEVSQINANVSGSQRGGTVSIYATEQVEVSGQNLSNQTAIGVRTSGVGGRLKIETAELLLTDGGAIDTSPFENGTVGRLIIQADEFVHIQGVVSSDFRFPSGIFGRPSREGKANTIQISTRQLLIEDGGLISASNFGRTGAGQISISATDWVELRGTNNNAVNPQASEIAARGRFGSGEAGTIQIETQRLTVQAGANISAETVASGQGGNLTIRAREIDVSGTSIFGAPSTIQTSSSDEGNAGSIRLRTELLTVSDQGQITVSNEGSGVAGNLTVNAEAIALNQGRLTATTRSGSGANINLRGANVVSLQNQSQISAAAEARGNGGNVRIQAADGFVVAVPTGNSDILASAVGGNGGAVTIAAQSVLGLQQRDLATLLSDINVSSVFGDDGVVNLETPNLDPSQGLVELPEGFVDASRLVSRTCMANAREGASEFIVSGRGGLPQAPADQRRFVGASGDWATLEDAASVAQADAPLAIDRRPADVRGLESEPTRSASVSLSPGSSPMVEAQGWVMNSNGHVMLVAQTLSEPSQPRVLGGCHGGA